jgi:trans-aconitate methyltransferase
MEYKDSWKNINVFKKQLALNIEQFNSYPPHWNSFIRLISKINKIENDIKLIDIGCGCGAYYKLCLDNFKNINYFGIDYSPEAITVAKEAWKTDNFETIDLFDIENKFIQKFNLIHAGALLDVLENGNDALEFILSKQVKFIIIGRIDFTPNPSGSTTYTAYDEIKTYKYLHNINDFKAIIKKYNYNIIEIDGNSIALQYEKDSFNTRNIGPGWIVSDRSVDI